MAADFVNVLGESNNLKSFDLVTIPVIDGCKSIFPVPDKIYQTYLSKKINSCRSQHTAIINNKLLEQADSVVLASSWTDWSILLLIDTVNFLKEKGVSQVVIVGKKHQSMSGIKFISKYALRISSEKIYTARNIITDKLNREIKKLNSDFLFINFLDYFCNNSDCQRVTDSGKLIIYDNAHFSPEGAKYIGLKVNGSNWMNSLKSHMRE